MPIKSLFLVFLLSLSPLVVHAAEETKEECEKRVFNKMTEDQRFELNIDFIQKTENISCSGDFDAAGNGITIGPPNASTTYCFNPETNEQFNINTEHDCNKTKSKCETAETTYITSDNNLSEKCGAFIGGSPDGCRGVIKICEDCLEDDDDNENCVKKPGTEKSLCPQLRGDLLKQTKEDMKEAKEKITNLKESNRDLEGKIVEKQGKISGETAIFEEEVSKIKTRQIQARQALDDDLEVAKTKIDKDLETSIAEVNKNIAQALEVRHKFENAISKAYRDLRLDKNKLYAQCRSLATQQLANYRKRRQQAIANGSFKKSSLKSLMQKNRVSFAQKDDARFKHYYNLCLSSKRTVVKELEKRLKESLKQIGQKRKEYLAMIERLKKDLNQKTQSASIKKGQALKNFYNKLHGEMKKFHSEEQVRTKKYRGKHAQLSKEMQQLQYNLQKDMGTLEETEKKKSYHYQLVNQLKDKGAKEDKDFGTVLALAKIADGNLDNLLETCECTKEKSEEDVKNDAKFNSTCVKYLDKDNINTISADNFIRRLKGEKNYYLKRRRDRSPHSSGSQ